VSSVGHLVGRFIGSIRPGPPATDDEDWAIGHLRPGEVDIWRQMSNPDRRHAVGVARKTVAMLGTETDSVVDPVVVTAALLHDCGKVVSGYRTPARVVATLVWSTIDHTKAAPWLDRGRPFRRLAQYRLHPELGSEMLAAAGADPVVVAWAREHHRPIAAWSLAPEVGLVLKACDGD
jgi:hypothetical protein